MNLLIKKNRNAQSVFPYFPLLGNLERKKQCHLQEQRSFSPQDVIARARKDHSEFGRAIKIHAINSLYVEVSLLMRHVLGLSQSLVGLNFM